MTPHKVMLPFFAIILLNFFPITEFDKKVFGPGSWFIIARYEKILRCGVWRPGILLKLY